MNDKGLHVTRYVNTENGREADVVEIKEAYINIIKEFWLTNSGVINHNPGDYLIIFDDDRISVLTPEQFKLKYKLKPEKF